MSNTPAPGVDVIVVILPILAAAPEPVSVTDPIYNFPLSVAFNSVLLPSGYILTNFPSAAIMQSFSRMYTLENLMKLTLLILYID